MWLSASGQTATIRAQRGCQQHPGDRRPPDGRTPATAGRAPGRMGASHHISNGRSRRMIAVSWRTGSATPARHRRGCSDRVHTAVEVAHELSRCRQRAWRIDDTPGLDAYASPPDADADARARPPDAPAVPVAPRSAARAARAAASSSEGAISISSERSRRGHKHPHVPTAGSRPSSRTCRSRRPSTGSGRRFGSGRPVRAATATSRATGSTSRHALAIAPPRASTSAHCTTTTWYPVDTRV